MNTLNKDLILKLGNLWEKGNMKRVYINKQNIEEIFGFKLELDGKKQQQAKIYYSLNDDALYSDVGMVRVQFNQHGIKCIAP